jgi:hypothetical protein
LLQEGVRVDPELLELVAGEERLDLVLDEPLQRSRDGARDELEPRRTFGDRGLNPRLDVDRGEDGLRELARECLLDSGIARERSDDADVALRLVNRAPSPQARRDRRRGENGDHDEDDREDLAEPSPLLWFRFELLDLFFQSIYLGADRLEVLRSLLFAHAVPLHNLDRGFATNDSRSPVPLPAKPCSATDLAV